MLAAVTLTMGVNATTLNEDGHFYCDFSLGDEDFNPWTVVSDGNDDGRWGGLETVSYTHLTLPTTSRV